MSVSFTTDSQQFEHIVREVLRRLAMLDSHGVAPPSPASPADQRQLQLDDRLITLASLDGKLDGVTRVCVPPKAIVTPAVHDELRDRKIELTRAAGSATANRPATFVAACGPEQFQLAQPLLSERIVECNSVDVANVEACKAVESHRRALVLCNTPAVLVCQANRNPKVRAAWGYNLAAAREAIDTLDANLLAIDARQQPVEHLKQMLTM